MTMNSDTGRTLGNFMGALKHNGVRVTLAGGAMRDVAMGRTPRDFDLWVLGSTFDFDAVSEALRDVRSLYDVEVACEEVYGGTYTNGDGEEAENLRKHLDYVMKLKVDDVPIDVIWAHGPDGELFETADDVLDTFDFSLNQVALTFSKDVPEVTSRFDGKAVKLNRKDVRKSRYAYLQAKFPELDWSEVTAFYQGEGAEL